MHCCYYFIEFALALCWLNCADILVYYYFWDLYDLYLR